MKGTKKSTWIKIGAAAAFILVYLFVKPVHTSIHEVIALFGKLDVEAVKTYILAFGIWAPIISFILMVFQSIAAPLPAFLITFANAGLFGWVKGAILSWLSAMAGAVLCFYIAKLYGRTTVERLTSKFALESIDVFFEKHGKYAVLIARLLPFISFDIVSYAAGLTSMSFWSFFWATGLGQLPATIVYSYVGGMLTGGVKTFVFGLFILFSISILLFLWKQMWNEKNKKRTDIEIDQFLAGEKDKCTGCKRCMDNCPMLKAYCNSPDELLAKIVEDQQVDAIIPFSCALCGYCTKVCPSQVNLNKVFLQLRMNIVKENKGVPISIPSRAVKFHQKNSFSKLFSTGAKGLSEKEIRRVFFPGCSLVAYNPRIVMKIYDYLQNKLPGTGIMLSCCGKPTHSMGDMESFDRYYASVQDIFDTNGIEEIIVACQNCYKSIGENNPRQKITSLWDVIAEAGIPEDKVNKGREIGIAFAIHDPCPTRENSHIHNSVRKIAKELDLETREMEFSREKTLCCGSGGMLGVTNSALAAKQMSKRANQTEEEYIVSYCQECVESMGCGGKKAVHILDLLFNDEMYIKMEFNQARQSTIKKWSNRYIAKMKVNRHLAKGGERNRDEEN